MNEKIHTFSISQFPLKYWKYKTNNITIILKHIEESSGELRAVAEAERLPTDFRELEKRRTERRLRQYFATLLLLAAEGFEGYTYGVRGNPELFSEQGFLSISHSGEFLALAISDYKIGIDIEDSRISRNLDIASRFMNSRELEAFRSSGNPREYFLRIWTAKEAGYKVFSSWFAGIDFKEISVGEKAVEYRGISLFPLRFSNKNILGSVVISRNVFGCEC